MSDRNEPRGAGGERGSGDGERVASLLEKAGPRPEVPAEDLAAIKQAFRSAWEERCGRGAGRGAGRRATRPARGPWLALAAALVAGLGLAGWWWSFGPGAGPGTLARVEAVAGPVTVRPAGETAGPSRLSAGMEIAAGAAVETAGAGEAGAAWAAMRLTDGHSVRLDSASLVRLTGAFSLSLERGAVYLDSGGSREAESVTVRTPLGVARSLGTQFEVRLLGRETPSMRVRVREGDVRVEAGRTAYAAGPGVELTLHADGSVTRSSVAFHGPPWRWTLQAAPPLEIEGLPLDAFLDWVARETGWEIRYADPKLAAKAKEIVLHGSMGELTPDQALEGVLPGAGLEHRVEGGTLTVRRAPADGGR